MAPKRSSSAKPSPKASRSKSPAKPSPKASRSKTPVKAPSVTSPSPKKAPASPRGRKSVVVEPSFVSDVSAAATSSSRTSAVLLKETSVTSLPEKKVLTIITAKKPGFFDEADRIYDRSTTRMLNDLAGFLVIFIGMIYFTLCGYFLYRESYGIPAVVPAQ